MFIYAVQLLAVFLCSFVLVGVFQIYARHSSLNDLVNARSSHSIAVPRGGGILFSVIFFISLSVIFAQGLVSTINFISLLSGFFVAFLGFRDDIADVAIRWRLSGHFAAAFWSLFWVGGLPPLMICGFTIDLGWFGHMLAAVYLVWLLNLYNFMDGIDGIASVEAIFVCVSGALLYGVSSYLGAEIQLGQYLVPLFLAAAVAGFLIFNFPPAKVFMGDSGSGFLGITVGVLSLQAAWVQPQLLWAWLILLGVFVIDATFTLLRRLIRGDKVYEPHRTHAYQCAARLYAGHKPVTLCVLLINMLWLLPISLCVTFGVLDGFIGVLVSYIPLIFLALKLKAGYQQ